MKYPILLMLLSFNIQNSASETVVHVREGDPFSLNCTVRGKPSRVPLIWKYEDPVTNNYVKLFENCRSNSGNVMRRIHVHSATCSRHRFTLDFLSASLESAGKYACEVRGKRKIMTVVVTAINYNISIEVESESEGLIEGSQAMIVCQTPGRPSGTTLRWHYENKSGKRWLLAENWKNKNWAKSSLLGIHSTGCTGTRSCVLKILALRMQSEGKYTCSVNGKTASVSLKVLEKTFSVEVERTSYSDFVEGTAAKLGCRTPGRPRGKIIEWLYIGENGTQILLAKNYHLMNSRKLGISSASCQGSFYCDLEFKHLLLESSGTYMCRSGNKHSTVALKVKAAVYTVSASISPSSEVDEGQRVRIRCVTKGRPKGRALVWIYEGNDGRQSIIGQNHNIRWYSRMPGLIGISSAACSGESCYLDIDSLLTSAGKYTCKVGQTSSTVILKVNEAEVEFGL